jgi:hypothetical protein
MLNKTTDSLIKLRWPLLVLSLLIVALAFYGFKFFKFDASPRSYFVDGHPPLERFLATEERYGRDYRIFIMASAKEGDMFDDKNLKALLDITTQGWDLPFVRRVDSLTNYQFTSSEDDELYVDDFLSEELIGQTAKLAERKAIATSDIALVKRLISKDAKHAAVILSLTVDGTDREAEFGLVDQVYELEEAIKAKHPSIDIAVTGNLISNYHNIKIAIRDVMVMIPVMFALMFIMIGALLKSVSTVVVSLTVASMSAIGALGLGALFGVEFSMLAMNAMIISITVAVAHCIHIFTQLFTELRTKPKAQALAASLRINFFAVSMTSLTTLIGFLSLNFNDLPPAAALGNAAAIGTALAWLFSLTVLPALVMILPFKAAKTQSRFLETRMERLGDWVIKRKYHVLLSMSVLTIIMVVLSFSNILNDRFSELIHKPHIFRADNESIDRHFGGLLTAHYDIDSGSENNIADPEYLKNLDMFANYLRAQPEVQSVHSFADIIKSLNKSMHNDDPAYYSIPDSRELAAQYILLYEMSLPYGLDLSDQITSDKRYSRLMVSMPSADTRTIIDVEQRIWAWQQENLPKHMQHEGAAMAMIWAHLSRDSLTHSLEGSIIALTLISVVLLVVLKSLRYGLVSLIPNLMPAAFGFGVWYFISGEVGLGLTCVVIITIGIVVDDTVHFLAKYKKAIQENKGDAELAIRATFRQVGPALCITSMVLTSGFLVLALSKIISNSALGSVTAIILMSALLLDILLLPALLLLVDRNRKKQYQ